MARQTTIDLIEKQRSQNAIGEFIETEVEHPVYAVIESVSRQEFFSAGQIGLKAEFKANVFFYDYNGEDEAEVRFDSFIEYSLYQPQFISKTSSVAGDYYFKKTSSGWKLNGQSVNLLEYGILIIVPVKNGLVIKAESDGTNVESETYYSERYSIYRTFVDDDYIDLYLERKVGESSGNN